MRWKNRLAGGLLKDCGQRGEWAELYFMMLVAGLGMKVFRPFGQIGRYDVGVENQARLSRVQVKTTNYKTRTGGYGLNLTKSKGEHYQPGTIDFFAILVIPLDRWYIIPFEEMNGCSLFIKPNRRRNQKHADYLEAWHLLKDTGLTIQACVDPDWPEANEELEARVGIEPTHKGFADLSLTTWVPRPRD